MTKNQQKEKESEEDFSESNHEINNKLTFCLVRCPECPHILTDVCALTAHLKAEHNVTLKWAQLTIDRLVIH